MSIKSYKLVTLITPLLVLVLKTLKKFWTSCQNPYFCLRSYNLFLLPFFSEILKRNSSLEIKIRLKEIYDDSNYH